MDTLASFRSLRATMERCSEIVSDAYDLKPEQLQQFQGELPPGHQTAHRRQRYWVREHEGDLIVALPGTTHPLDWSSNMSVKYMPIDGSQPDPSSTTEQLEQIPCAHAGFFFRSETVPTLALLEQAAAKGCRLVLTGHSLGAAVANLCTLTALRAQKKARDAAATMMASRAAAAAAAVSSEQQEQQAAKQGKAKAAVKKAKLSPFQAAASAASTAAAEANHNHSYCSANSDILVSPQAALVDVVCVSFASPHYANAALANYIDENDWADAFVNVVVPEDYCLKLFNNVLTSAPPSEHNISRSSSSCSLNYRSSQGEDSMDALEHFADEVHDPGQTQDKQPLLEEAMSSSSTTSSIMTQSSSSSSLISARYSYQPGRQQPLISAMAGTRRKQKKQLSFALPVQQPLDTSSSGTAAAAAAADTAAAATAPGIPDMGPETGVLPALQVPPAADELAELEASGSWNELRSALPSSPSAASLSSLSSLNSTRSWTLLAYLPDMLIRSFSNTSSLSTNSSWGGSSMGSSPGGSRSGTDGGAPDTPAGGFMAPTTEAEAAVASAAVAASAVPEVAVGRCGLRHAKSSINLTYGTLAGSDGSNSSLSSLADAADAAEHVAAGLCGAGTGSMLPVAQQHQGRASSLRRSLSSASLAILSRGQQKLLQPLGASLKLGSSLAMFTALLPSVRTMALASRTVLNAASNLSEKAFNVPLGVLESGLIKALKPPMYQPVGQQWILSATGLVPQHQPIEMYPRHVHDVYWHKELFLVAFREHSILFYKRRLLQQASRR